MVVGSGDGGTAKGVVLVSISKLLVTGVTDDFNGRCEGKEKEQKITPKLVV